MDIATLFRPQQGFPVKVIDPRRCARRGVHIPATVADQHRLANGMVTNISEGGCELRLGTPFFPSHCLTLKLYPQDGTAAFLIPLAETVWVEREWVGVEFLRLSQEAKAKLQRLCSEPVTLAVGGSMPAMLPPGVYVEEVDPGIPMIPEVTSVTLRNGLEQWCKQELRWLMFEQNGPRTWGQVVQNIRGYLFELWAREALQGARAQEAFFVTCDRTTMTPHDLREGTLICLVGAAPVTPAEFIRYRIHIQLKPR